MTHEEILKKFKRLLKDVGAYKATMAIYTTHHKIRSDGAFLIRFKTLGTPPYNLIADADMFCIWTASSEEPRYWQRVNCLWKSKCVIENIILDRDFTHEQYDTIYSLLITVIRSDRNIDKNKQLFSDSEREYINKAILKISNLLGRKYE